MSDVLQGVYEEWEEKLELCGRGMEVASRYRRRVGESGRVARVCVCG